MTFYPVYVDKVMIGYNGRVMLLPIVQDSKDISLMIIKIITGGYEFHTY